MDVAMDIACPQLWTSYFLQRNTDKLEEKEKRFK